MKKTTDHISILLIHPNWTTLVSLLGEVRDGTRIILAPTVAAAHHSISNDEFEFIFVDLDTPLGHAHGILCELKDGDDVVLEYIQQITHPEAQHKDRTATITLVAEEWLASASEFKFMYLQGSLHKLSLEKLRSHIQEIKNAFDGRPHQKSRRHRRLHSRKTP